MRDNLEENRAEFEQLVRMANDDYGRTKIIRIAYDFTRLEQNWGWPRPEPQWGITQERWNHYRALFRKLQLPAGLQRVGYRYNRLHFMVYGVGMAGEGREYGYLWSPTPAAEMNDSSKETYSTRPLGGEWYQYEWVTP